MKAEDEMLARVEQLEQKLFAKLQAMRRIQINRADRPSSGGEQSLVSGQPSAVSGQ